MAVFCDTAKVGEKMKMHIFIYHILDKARTPLPHNHLPTVPFRRSHAFSVIYTQIWQMATHFLFPCHSGIMTNCYRATQTAAAACMSSSWCDERGQGQWWGYFILIKNGLFLWKDACVTGPSSSQLNQRLSLASATWWINPTHSQKCNWSICQRLARPHRTPSPAPQPSRLRNSSPFSLDPPYPPPSSLAPSLPLSDTA